MSAGCKRCRAVLYVRDATFPVRQKGGQVACMQAHGYVEENVLSPTSSVSLRRFPSPWTPCSALHTAKASLAQPPLQTQQQRGMETLVPETQRCLVLQRWPANHAPSGSASLESPWMRNSFNELHMNPVLAAIAPRSATEFMQSGWRTLLRHPSAAGRLRWDGVRA